MGEDPAAGDKSFEDREVCRAYLCGLCPVDLLKDTKISMGPCTKIHARSLKEKYEAALKNDGFRPFTRDLEEALDVRSFVTILRINFFQHLNCITKNQNRFCYTRALPEECYVAHDAIHT